MQGMKQSLFRSRQSSKDGKKERLNLHALRRSMAWTSQPHSSSHHTPRSAGLALDERLESWLVLELHKDGNRRYLSVSVRGLYKHVLSAITNGSKGDDNLISPKSPRRYSKKVMQSHDVAETLVATIPLGHAIASSSGDHLPRAEEGLSDNVAPVESTERSVSFSLDTEEPVRPASNAESAIPGRPNIPKARAMRRRTVSYGEIPERNDAAVTYRERLGGYLHPRDMRRLVTPFSASNEPELIVRRHVMLLNFDPLRAIILRDRLLVLIPDGADSVLAHLENRVRGEDSDTFLPAEEEEEDDLRRLEHVGRSLRQEKSMRIFGKLRGKGKRGGQTTSAKGMSSVHDHATPTGQESADDDDDTTDEMEHSDDEYEAEWSELRDSKWVNLPFELRGVDAVLHVVSDLLANDTAELNDASMSYIHKLLTDNHSMSEDPLTIIRAVKDAVREMTSRVNGFVKSIERVLDEDEDMALMNLSRLLTHPDRFIHPVSAEVLDEESDEPELILECYLQNALSLANSLHLIQGQIDSAAELVDQKQDSIRNRLLFANMMISIFSLCITCASLVGSIMGMNVKNYLENDENAFRQITFGTLAGTAFMAVFIIYVLYKSRTIPSLSTLFANGDSM